MRKKLVDWCKENNKEYILNEWDKDKNNSVDINSVYYATHTEVWWKCPNGHSYRTKIAVRTSLGSNCPYCSHLKAIAGENDLFTIYPNLEKEWDYEKNDLNPRELLPSSNKKVWWKCEKGHSYYAYVSGKKYDKGCPYCAGREVLKGFNDISTTHPGLLSTWNYEKNNILPTDISKGSHKKVWWKCEKGHEWEAIIPSRINGNGCPICAREHQSSLPEKAIYFYLKKRFKDIEANVKCEFLKGRELDIFIPQLKLGIEYDGANWHQNPDRDKIKDDLCYENDVNLIRIMEEGCKLYDSSSYKIESKYHKSKIDYLEPALIKLINLIESIYSIKLELDINLNRDYSYILEEYITYNKELSFGNKYPEFIKYWNYERNGSITPYMVTCCTNREFWFRCSKGHEFKATPSRIVEKKSIAEEYCPYCNNRRIIIGENDIFTVNPELKKIWNYEKNEKGLEYKHSIGSDEKVWWKCSKGHEFQETIYIVNKFKAKLCPYCSHRYPVVGETDLATTNPALIKEWNYEKNGDIKPNQFTSGSDKKVWWKCKNGHEWQATINSRVLGNGCRECSTNMRKRRVYNIELNEVFDSAKDAANELNLYSASHIYKCCKGIKKSAYGYHWKFYDEINKRAK